MIRCGDPEWEQPKEEEQEEEEEEEEEEDSSEDFEDYESEDSISVGTEDSYETESLCSNNSYECNFMDDCESTNESTEDDTKDEFYLK